MVVHVWDVAANRQSRTPSKEKREKIHYTGFLPDGRWIISGSEKRACIWDSADGKIIVLPLISEWTMVSVMLSPDGALIASEFGPYCKTAYLWDIPNGHTIQSHTMPDTIKSVTFSPDGTKLACGSYDSTINIWSTVSRETIASLVGHSSELYRIVFTPNGNTIVSTYMDLSILIWNVANGHVVGAIELGFSETLTPVSFSLDGKQILIQRGDWEEIAIWDAIHTKDIPSHRWHEEIKKYFQVITDKQWVHNSLDGYLLYFLPVDQVGNWYDNNPWWAYHSAKLVAENKSGMMTIVDATETLHHFGISM